MKMLKVAQRGFTFIELLIVVAIIGILAAISVPSYTDYILKGRAAEATATLASLRIQMEQCYQDERDYTQCNAFCAPAGGDIFFSYSCAGGTTPDAYTLSAAGRAEMGNFSFSVDEGNNRNSTYQGTPGAGCWLTGKSGTC